FAIQTDGNAPVVYVLEVNPRASRTVPFVSKATGQPLAKIAARCMVGQKLVEQKGPDGRMPHEVIPPYFSVKEAVFPFNKFPGVEKRTPIADSRHHRRAALADHITYYTSMAGCEEAVEGMKHQDDLVVVSLQELHAELNGELH